MMVIRYQSVCEFNIENVVNDVIKLDEYKRVKENLYNNWVNHNKFYYTIDLDGTYKDVSACFIYNAATHWSNNSALIKCLAKHVSNRNNFIKQIIKTGNNSLKLDIKSLQGYI